MAEEEVGLLTAAEIGIEMRDTRDVGAFEVEDQRIFGILSKQLIK